MITGKNRPSAVQSQDPHAEANKQCEKLKNEFAFSVLKDVSFTIKITVITPPPKQVMMKEAGLSVEYNYYIVSQTNCYYKYYKNKTKQKVVLETADNKQPRIPQALQYMFH